MVDEEDEEDEDDGLVNSADPDDAEIQRLVAEASRNIAARKAGKN